MASRLTAIIVSVIVAATLIAGLMVGAQRDDSSGPVDLMIVNGKVYPADGRGVFAEAIAVRGNQILRVGSNRDIKRMRRPGAVVIDAHGGAVLPGFNDSHLHFIEGGLSLDQVNLAAATTLDEIQKTIRAFADAHPDRPWVLGRGWYSPPLPGGLPTRQQLDALVPDRPAFLVSVDGHTGWANSKALSLAGITRRTPSPRRGTVVKDPRTGEPTGVLKDAAQALMDPVLPIETREDRLHAIRNAIAETQRLGITSVQNTDGSAEDFQLYDELRRAGELKVRVYSALSIGPGLTEQEADRLDDVRRMYPDDPLFKTGAVSLVADGAIQSHPAALLAPYANRPTSGRATFSLRDLTRIVDMMDRRGWQILIEASGDGTVRMVLDAFEHAAKVNPLPPRGRRHRVEHVEAIDPLDVARLATLGVVASGQPARARPRPLLLETLKASLGPDRAAPGWAYGGIHNAGGRLAFGSSWPSMTLDPRQGLFAAVHHATPDGQPADGGLPEQELPLPAAVDAYTSGAAYASFDDHRKGTLARGMLADIVILSADVFSLPPERLLDPVVSVTIFDGKVVYQREETSD